MKKRGLCIALCLCLLTGALPALAQDGRRAARAQ